MIPIAQVSKDLNCSVPTVRRHVKKWPEDYQREHTQTQGRKNALALDQTACSRLASEIAAKAPQAPRTAQDRESEQTHQMELVGALQAHIASLERQIQTLERELDARNSQIETLTVALARQHALPWYKRLLPFGKQDPDHHHL